MRSSIQSLNEIERIYLEIWLHTDMEDAGRTYIHNSSKDFFTPGTSTRIKMMKYQLFSDTRERSEQVKN